MNEFFNQFSSFNIQDFTNNITVFQFKDLQSNWQDTLSPAFVSAIISGIVTFLINYYGNRVQQRMALYNKKYEFWLDFCKEYFSIEPFLSYMIQQKDIPSGIFTNQTEDEIKTIYNNWLQKWKHFYEMVRGNERIYLEPEKIEVSMINSFFTALDENLENLSITKNIGNIKTYTISAESITRMITRAKKIFEMNAKIDSDSSIKYFKILDKYTKKYQNNNKKNKKKKLSYDEMFIILEKMSDDGFVEALKDNLDDTTKKLTKLVLTESFMQKISAKWKIFKKKFFPNELEKFIKDKK